MSSFPPIGAHLVSPRTGYSHHGVHLGDGKVIHYSGMSGGWTSGPVAQTDLTSFADGKGFSVKTYKNCLSEQEILRRAQSRVGESAYDVFNNNCEHFCLWCIVGDHTSYQIDNVVWVTAPWASTVIGLGARGIVAASGSVAGLSGAAGVMSSLASTGAYVGGGAIAGMAVLGLVPGAAMASLVNKMVLADNPTHDVQERESRTIGRVASYVGAGAGTVGSIATIGAVGTTAGLSAAGITSGLAAIGGVVGGGMAAGVFVATAAPVAAAALVGYGAYKIVRFVKAKSRPSIERT
jgi:hypothetical protein